MAVGITWHIPGISRESADVFLFQLGNHFKHGGYRIRMIRIQVVRGDITQQTVGAIVNASNITLLGGHGVDGAIHLAAGPKLLEECRTLGGCQTGEAKITRAYNLPAKWVIHAVGPVWSGGNQNEDTLLANCYRNALTIARDHHIQSMAFPAISTGAYHFPPKRAAAIAVREVTEFLERNPLPEKIHFVCFDEETYRIYLTLQHPQI